MHDADVKALHRLIDVIARRGRPPCDLAVSLLLSEDATVRRSALGILPDELLIRAVMCDEFPSLPGASVIYSRERRDSLRDLIPIRDRILALDEKVKRRLLRHHQSWILLIGDDTPGIVNGVANQIRRVHEFWKLWSLYVIFGQEAGHTLADAFGAAMSSLIEVGDGPKSDEMLIWLFAHGPDSARATAGGAASRPITSLDGFPALPTALDVLDAWCLDWEFDHFGAEMPVPSLTDVCVWVAQFGGLSDWIACYLSYPWMLTATPAGRILNAGLGDVLSRSSAAEIEAAISSDVPIDVKLEIRNRAQGL